MVSCYSFSHCVPARIHGLFAKLYWPSTSLAAQQKIDSVYVDVFTLGGNPLRFKLSKLVTVVELKELVAERVSARAEEVLLFRGTCALQDDISLVDCFAGEQTAVLQVRMLRRRIPTVVSGCCDGELKVWNLDRGTCSKTLRGHEQRVTCVAVDWLTRRALCGSTDTYLRMWDVDAGNGWTTLSGHVGPVACCDADWETNMALSGSSAGELLLWDLELVCCEKVFANQGAPIVQVSLDTTSKRVVSCAIDHNNSIVMWDLQRACQLLSLVGHTARVVCFTVNLDGMQTVSCSCDGALKVWEGTECSQTINTDETISCVAVYWEISRCIVGHADGRLVCWDFDLGLALQTLQETTWIQGRGALGEMLYMPSDVRGVMSIVLSNSVRRLICGYCDGTIKVWDLSLGICVLTLQGHNDGVFCLAVDWV